MLGQRVGDRQRRGQAGSSTRAVNDPNGSPRRLDPRRGSVDQIDMTVADLTRPDSPEARRSGRQPIAPASLRIVTKIC